MKKNDIIWNPDGWTIVEIADSSAHKLEISALAENGVVIEVRRRHSRGEEEILKKKLDADHTLPMALADFKEAVETGELKLK